MITVGVISDTHGLVRPEAKTALAGVDALVHAGDIGKPAVLDELREIAPVTVIRGNIDKWANDLPDDEVLEIEGRYLYVLHSVGGFGSRPEERLDLMWSFPVTPTNPAFQKKDGVLYLNPGSAGPRRFTLPIAVAKLYLSDTGIEAEIIELEI